MHLKKAWISLLCLLLFRALPAQETPDSPYSAYLPLSGQAWTLAGDVNVRKGPGRDFESAGKLPIDTEVEIVSVSQEHSLISGLDAPWCQVNWKRDGKYSSGWIWAGFLTTDRYMSELEPGLVFLLGISSITVQDEYERLKMQVRAVKNGTELGRHDFEAIGSGTTSHSLELTDGKGIASIPHLLHFNFSDGFCGGAFGDVYLSWTGTAFAHIKTLNCGFDAPMFYDESLIFPKDEEGVAGKILFRVQSGESTEEGPSYDQNETKAFTWNGKTLVPTR